MNVIRKWLPDVLRRDKERQPALADLVALDTTARARPGQGLDAARYLYAPPGLPDAGRQLATYAVSTWVNMAVSKIASAAPGGKMRVFRRENESLDVGDHPVLELLGRFGKPNDAQDRIEFFEESVTFAELAGNCYWYWFSQGGGAPSEVFGLNPMQMRVLPGRARTVEGYEYEHMGQRFRLSRAEVSHFRRPHPLNGYYGLSAIEALMVEIVSDVNMAAWNRDFFGGGVALPAGILVIPENTADAEMERVKKEFRAEYGSQRATAVVRAQPGSVSWFDGGLKHHDLDFEQGRLLSRQAVLNVLDLPMGLFAETSTEAHARVAERQFWGSVLRRLDRFAAKLTVDALPFWPGWRDLAVGFVDERQRFADWEQEERKIGTLLKVFTVDEVRAREYHSGPRPVEEARDETATDGDDRRPAVGGGGDGDDGVSGGGAGEAGEAGGSGSGEDRRAFYPGAEAGAAVGGEEWGR